MLDVFGLKIVAITSAVMGLSMQLRQRRPRDGIVPRPPAPKLEEIDGATKTLQQAKELIEELKLESSTYQLTTIQRNNEGSEFARLNLHTDVMQLHTRMTEDLAKRYFVFIEPGNESFWGNEDAFKLGKKFKEAQADIEAAGNCFSYQQPTACIFHLMRAMEVAVRQLARRPHMNITITPKTTWRQITGAMDQKISAMPDSTKRQKRKKEDWESARANLHHVGSVWRNSTMHPAKTYTQSQARDVFDACRVFMNSLCAL